MTFPSAFAGACGFEKEASEPRASVSAERTVYDALYDLIAPGLARALAEWERAR